jgi:hypothetical protein
MKILAILAAACLALAASIFAAQAFGLGEGNRFGRLGAFNKSGTVTPPITTGDALLVDQTNPALLVDGVNPACLVGGC